MSKKNYSLTGNIYYVFKKMFEYKKRLKYKLMLQICSKLMIPFFTSAVPAIAVALIRRRVRLEEFIGIMFISVAVYTGIIFLEQYERNTMKFEIICARIEIFGFGIVRNQTTLDYNNIEPQDKQLMYRKANAAVESNDVGIELLMKNVPEFITNTAGILLYGGMVTVLNYKILIVLAVMTISNFVLSHYAIKYENDIVDERAKVYRNINYIYKNANSSINGKDERIYHMEMWFIKAFKELTKKRVGLFTKVEQKYLLPELSDNIWLFIRDIIAYGMLTVGVINGTISIEKFTFYLGILSSFSAQLKASVLSFSEMKRANIDVINFRKYCDIENSYNHGTGINIPKGDIAIEFKNMCFRYPGADKDTIHNLNLKIDAKSKIAVVGMNGAGKTTLVKILSGLYYPTSGDVLINGKSMKDFNINEYQSMIGTIFQDVIPLGFTIAQNVSPQNEIDHDKVQRCLERAGLNEKVDELKNKENTYLTQVFSKDGIMLSGGEMQKLMLARALYKDAPLLILDEPTAALDPIAESEMYEGYNNLTKDKTSIFISHRLSSTKFCDRILFFENGCVAEDGTHDELMKKQGKYAKMFEIQSHYYKEGINCEGSI